MHDVMFCMEACIAMEPTAGSALAQGAGRAAAAWGKLGPASCLRLKWRVARSRLMMDMMGAAAAGPTEKWTLAPSRHVAPCGAPWL